MKKILGLLTSVFIIQTGLISEPQTFKQHLLSKVRNFRETHEHAIIREFIELLSIPNVSSDRVNIRIGNLWRGIETFAAVMTMGDTGYEK
jgi:hypothetical protein